MFKYLFFLISYLCVSFCFSVEYTKQLSLEEKVGQLLIVHFQGESVNPDAKILVQQIKVGGIIYYNWSNGLTSPIQVQTLSTGLQKLAQENPLSIPLFISTDQEGGIVSRLSKGFTHFAGNRALGITQQPELAYLSALAMGNEMKAAGVNLNFAPVVDVNCNPFNPIIGVRAFSDDVNEVISFAEKALQGYIQAHLMTTLKHFPGHGDVAVDSHQDLPVLQKSVEQLRQLELLPFEKLASSADLIMTAHILVPAFDANNCATLSKKTLDYLKNELDFKGLIISDSLVMEGVLKKCQTVDEAAIQAFNAGCDILLLGGRQLNGMNKETELDVKDIQRIHTSIVDAVKSGRISQKKVDEAVEKILALKNKFLLEQGADIPLSTIRCEDHCKLAKQVAEKALQILQNDSQNCLFLADKKIQIIAPHVLKTALEETSLLSLGKSSQVYYFQDLGPKENENTNALHLNNEADVTIICTYNAWKNPAQTSLIQKLLESKKPVILLITRDSVDSTLFPKATLMIHTSNPTAISLQAVADFLKNNY